MTRRTVSNKAWGRAFSKWEQLRAVPPLLRTPAQQQEMAFYAREFVPHVAARSRQVCMPLDHTVVPARDYVAEARQRVIDGLAKRGIQALWHSTVSGRWPGSRPGVSNPPRTERSGYLD